MNILVLLGSPRKKDGYQVCKHIEAFMKEKGDVTFDFVHLSHLRIEDCRGCDQCFQKGEQFCPVRDDLQTLKDKLLQADGIVFDSPVYAYQITGMMKRMIDRFSYLFHRPELVGKPAFIVTTTGGGGQKEVIKYLKMTACGWGCNVTGSLSVISTFFSDRNGKNPYYSPEYHNKTLKTIEKSAKGFYDAVQSKRLPVPGYYELYMFHGLKSKTMTSKADYDYWEQKGWLTSRYFYDTKIGPLKRLFGSIMNYLVKAVWDKMQKGNIEKNQQPS